MKGRNFSGQIGRRSSRKDRTSCLRESHSHCGSSHSVSSAVSYQAVVFNSGGSANKGCTEEASKCPPILDDDLYCFVSGHKQWV